MDVEVEKKVPTACHLCGKDSFTVYCKKYGHTLYRCTHCHLVFVYPIPKNLEAVYGEGYFHNMGDQQFGYADYDGDKDSMRDVFVKYLDIFERKIKERTILDVGCATGYFLDIAKERGWKTYGAELSAYAAHEAETRGHVIYRGAFPGMSTTTSVAVVTMWDVLEHVDAPRQYLEKAHDILEPGGYIAINTVDIGSWWARIMKERWHLIVPPEHLYYYTEENLKFLLAHIGFETVQVAKIGKKFSLSYFFMTGYRWQGFVLWKWLGTFFDTPFWRRIGVPVNFRDNVFILAQKKHNRN